MNKRYSGLILLFALLLTTGPVFAATIIPDDLAIDFRSSEWLSANGASSFTVGGVTAAASGIGPAANWRSFQLNQKDKDGLGVRTYNSSNEQINEIDEINAGEQLRISFGIDGMSLSGVWLANLFDWKDGLDENFGADEYGHLVLNGTTPIDFGAKNNGQYPGASWDANGGYIGTNGELWVSFGGLQTIYMIDFFAGSSTENPFSKKDETGWINPTNEYSVAGFTTTTPVPDPSSLLLLGSGLLAIAGIKRRRK